MLQTDLDPSFDPSIAEEFGYSVQGAATEFLGVPLFEADSLLNLFVRLSFNLIISLLLVWIYYSRGKRRDYATTFMLFSATMFLLICLMENLKLQIGFTLGLFAIFGMIRYRTETVPTREMTYLFIIIGISVINGLSMAVSWAELLLANGSVVLMAFLAEQWLKSSRKTSKIIVYEKIENIVPERRQELLDDLEKRTGVHPVGVEIGSVDFLRDVAFIKMFYILPKGEENTIGHITKFKES